MNKRELGMNYFHQGYNCAQAVALAFKEELGIVAENPILFKSVKGKNVFCDLYYVKQDIDLNEDGEVDFEEFKQLMMGTKSRELLQENMANTRKG